MSEPVLYRLAPALVVRLVGTAFVLLALLLLAATVVVSVLDGPMGAVVVAVLLAVVACLALGWWLRRRAWVLRWTDDGYRVRLVRGAGVREARWVEVEDAVTTHRRDAPCVVLRLRDGRTTTIPVTVLAVDREQFVRDLQQRLQRGHGLRTLPRG